MFTQLYSTRSLRSLPRQVSRADFGGLEELVAGYVRARDPNRLDLSAAMYYSTWCREEYPFHQPIERQDSYGPRADTLADGFGVAIDRALRADGIDRVCEIFSVEPAPPLDDLPLASSIPTLIFAGAFDPITPPEWSRQAAEALGSATYVEMPDHGHGMTTSCPADIRLEFLVDPLGDLDTTCVDETTLPDFD